MPDIPGNNSTTTSITVGGSVSSTLEFLGDRDWIRIDLVAGQAITVLVDGTTLEDPYVYIHNAAGTVLFENDDINPGVLRDSQVSFTAPTTGTYYIEVGSFEDSYTGDYTVSVSNYTPPPLASYDTIAQELVVDYWGAGQQHHFDVTQGGSITVNITGLTPAGKTLALAALAEWTDIIGVTFTQVTSGGQITFDDNQSGAATDGTWSNGIATSAHVNVSTQWLAQYGTGLNSYSFQTYIHEIGHALGLGHAGYYNGTASYPNDARFQNDAWVTSIMSYFDQNDNTYFAGQGFTSDFVVTPMLADIVAMSQMYGLSTTTRTGNTTYGFNSNAGSAVYNAAQNPNVAYTIFDSGGTDTLDYSGFNSNQLINLNPETFSNVGPGVGNVAIARGVVIENAIGGSGWDTLIGNSADNVLNGGGGTVNTISYEAATGPVVIDTSITGPQNTGNAGTDTLLNYQILIGSAFNDTLTGRNGTADQQVNLRGGDGNDTLIASSDGDTLYGDAGNDNLQGGGSHDILDGGTGDDVMSGGLGDDTLYAGSGNDQLDGGGGVDGLAGGTGDDVYVVDNVGDVVTEQPSEGTDLVNSSVTFSLWAGFVENLTLTGAAAIDGTGNNLDNILLGNGAANSLFGGWGNDTLVGGGGNDVLDGGLDEDSLDGGAGSDAAAYASAVSAVTVSLALTGAQNTGGAGIDTLLSIENLTGSAFNDTLSGDSNANVLSGGDGNDVLIGGAGADTMIGGLGDDKYYIADVGDLVVEAANEGDDLVFVLGTYTLAQGVSIETLYALNQSSTDPLILTGNEFGQSLYGNLGDNYLNGGQGIDYLVGLDGNDNLLGGTGADDMQGGTGNDVYYADQAGDRIFETAGQGSDLVVATASYTLTDGAAVETMSADPNAGSINLTGNEFAQSIYGNSGNNIITGMGGADFLVGGAGNDTYYVDPSDFIGEDVGGGDDSIVVATSYILREGNEIETLVALNQDSTDPVNLTGNEFGQSLYGSQGANVLNGGGGADFLVGLGGNDFLIGGPGNDILAGGTGNDLYYVETGDWVFEAAGEGDDLVVAFSSFALLGGHSVETLSAAEGSAAINLTGNELGQSIYGNAGDNRISGMGGSDYILGGGGNDTFVIGSAAGVGTIADYGAGDVVDVTQLLNVANGTDVVGGGYLKVTASGQLQIDANGGADTFVTVANVSGSGAVGIRYIAGGNLADVSVNRSAGQEAAGVSKLVPDAQAADIHSDAPLVHPGDGWASASDAALHDPLEPFATHLDPHSLI